MIGNPWNYWKIHVIVDEDSTAPFNGCCFESKSMAQNYLNTYFIIKTKYKIMSLDEAMILFNDNRNQD